MDGRNPANPAQEALAELITVRAAKARKLGVYFWCEACRVITQESWADKRWDKVQDDPLAWRFRKGVILCRHGCGRPADGMTVQRWTGAGSQMETLLALKR